MGSKHKLKKFNKLPTVTLLLGLFGVVIFGSFSGREANLAILPSPLQTARSVNISNPKYVPITPATALNLLRSYDLLRQRGWQHRDLSYLAKIYHPQSPALRADRRAYRYWSRYQILGMGRQIYAIKIRKQTNYRLVVELADRFLGVKVNLGGIIKTMAAQPKQRWRVIFYKPVAEWKIYAWRPS